MSNLYAVILAGGSGTRFWPKSRKLSPKQLCCLTSQTESMLELTIQRLEEIVPAERRMIVTHRDQLAKTRQCVGASVSQILAEPEARNTSAALVWAALEIFQKDPHAKILSLHADQDMESGEVWRRCLTEAVSAAGKDQLMLLGVTPRWAETGFGYIEKGEPLGQKWPHTFRVRSFQEKPSTEVASGYLQSGRHLWNTGLFLLPAALFLEEVRTYLPEIFQTVERFRQATSDDERTAIYGSIPKVAIDNGVFEVSRRVSVVECKLSWRDVGSWTALEEFIPKDPQGNVLCQKNSTLLLDCSGVTVDTDGPFVAALGVKDLVVVVSQGAILVCNKDRAQDVKKICEALDLQERQDLL